IQNEPRVPLQRLPMLLLALLLGMLSVAIATIDYLHLQEEGHARAYVLQKDVPDDVQGIFALHVSPYLHRATIASRPSPLLAGSGKHVLPSTKDQRGHKDSAYGALMYISWRNLDLTLQLLMMKHCVSMQSKLELAFLGESNVELDESGTAAEDFQSLLPENACCTFQYRIKESYAAFHTQQFVLVEDIHPIGAALHVVVAIPCLNDHLTCIRIRFSLTEQNEYQWGTFK
ncbi:hypothetical protein RJ641_027938, partial [Dillenia turbinata]